MTSMHVTLVAFFVSVAVTIPFRGVDAQSGESIQSFSADISVEEDGRVVVTETIVYNFSSPRHGISRDLPTVYTDDSGTRLKVPISVSSVLKPDGSPWKFSLTHERYGIQVKIGDPDVMISGTHTYVITYVAEGAIRYFDDHDELYWNVTGFDWKVPINRVNAIVRMPGSVQGSEMRTRCYTGTQGLTEQECLVNIQRNAAHFVADGPLTVVVGFPSGRVDVLLAKTSGGPLSAFIPFLIPLALFAFLFRRWWLRGRDPEGRGTVVVQYDGPKDLTPAEAGVLIDETAHIRDIVATIIDLAVRGYIRIEETAPKGFIFKKKGYRFVRLKQDASALKEFEGLILDAMFQYGGATVSLSRLEREHAFHTYLPKIKKALYKEVVSAGLFPTNPDRVRGIYIGIGIALAFVAVFFVGFAYTMILDILGNAMLAVNMAVSFGLVVLLFIGFAPFMPRKTQKGVRLFEHVSGFKEYIEKAEKYRLEWQETEKMFAKFLPFAMAFGIVDKYTKAFDGIEMEPPDWYVGHGDISAFNAGMLVSSFSGLETGINRAITSTPQKSGSGSGFSSGGGFSGGGFGGGGGGSW